MVPKHNRLSRREFEDLLARGRRMHGAQVSIVYAPARKGQPHAKYGVVVSKKTARQANTRNLLRRRVYAILGAMKGTPRDIAVFMKPGGVTLSFQDLRNEINKMIPQ